MYRCLSILVSVVALMLSCHPGRPGYVLSEGKMEKVLYDYHLAQAMAEQTHDSLEYRRYAYVQKVFEKHGITEAEFDSSMVYYSSNSGLLYNIYERMRARLEAETAQAGAGSVSDAYASLTADGDTANIWMGDNMLVMTQAAQTNHHAFAYVADSTFRSGDELIFHGHTFFLQRDGRSDAIVSLSVHYTGDSVLSTTKVVHGDADFDVALTAARNLEIEGVSGFVYFPTSENRDGSPRRLLIQKPVLVRIHHKR